MAKGHSTKDLKWLISRKISRLRLKKSTNYNKAKRLGYKRGMILIAGRINKGGRKSSMPNHGRSTTKLLKRKNIRMSLQNRLEKRVSKHYSGFEVINSYYICENGQYKWYEIIMGHHGARGRAYRGLTSSAKKNIKP